MLPREHSNCFEGGPDSGWLSRAELSVARLCTRFFQTKFYHMSAVFLH
jgi:hypothetical protein